MANRIQGSLKKPSNITKLALLRNHPNSSKYFSNDILSCAKVIFYIFTIPFALKGLNISARREAPRKK
jgi:hypothetical protein